MLTKPVIYFFQPAWLVVYWYKFLINFQGNLLISNVTVSSILRFLSLDQLQAVITQSNLNYNIFLLLFFFFLSLNNSNN